MNMVRTQVNLPEDLKVAAYAKAGSNFESYSSLMRRALRQYLYNNRPVNIQNIHVENTHIEQGDTNE